MSTEADIVERLLEKRGVSDNRWPGPTDLDKEAAAEITKLRAERDAAADRIGVLHDDIIALTNKNESLQAAVRDMRERAAHAAYVACAETRHVTLGNAVSRSIMSLPVTSAVLATEETGQ